MASRPRAWAAASRVLITVGLVAFTANCTSPPPHPAARPAPMTPSRAEAESAPATAAEFVPLESLNLAAVDQEWGTPHAGRSVDGRPLTIAGQHYERGLGTHASSELLIDLHGAAARFEALVGVDDECAGRGTLVFQVACDGVIRFDSGVMRGGDAARAVALDLAGVRQLALRVEDAGDGIDYDHADWADARIVLQPGAATRPVAIAAEPAPPPQPAPFDPHELAIHPPRITGGTPGRPFLFLIPASGPPPLRFHAAGLPAGLTCDPDRGIISGSLAAAGRTDVQLRIDSPAGTATAVLTIVAGPDALALTPPMGWNSWNAWGTAVDEDKVRDAADWLVFSGLAARGYHYVNIDDAWEAGRDADGRIQTNEKFPDTRALADYVHAHGLKLGIYSSPGPRTCAQFEGSFGYEYLDAARYAEWGIDYLKYDWCSYGGLVPPEQRIGGEKGPPNEAALRRPYEVMRGALDACGRDIVYSLCQYGMGDVSKWGGAVGGNLWRTTGDIVDTWSSMSRIGFSQSDLAAYAGPGRWNDPDMLVLGHVGWGPHLHPTRLTPHEQVTHMTLWALLAAPLLIGCDLTQLDDFTLALLGNPEVLEINQDPLGRPATRIWAEDRCEIWSRPLANGDTAVGVFNRGRRAATVSVNWSQLGRAGRQSVHDAWRRAGVGSLEGACEAVVPAHGALLLRVANAWPVANP